jgi:hypothetical protein
MKTISEIVVPLDGSVDLQALTEDLILSLKALRSLLNTAAIGRRGFSVKDEDEAYAIDEYLSYIEALAATVYKLQDEELNDVANSAVKAKSKAGGAS